LKVGFSTFYINRTNRSGILNAGVIGGKEQTGNWKIDARFNKKDLINRIQRIAAYKEKIELHNCDAVKLVKTLRKTLPTKSLFYFDPPYYVKGKDLYLNYYQDRDHQEIATEIRKVNKQKWIVTYDSVPSIKNLYTDFRQVKYNLNYSAAKPSKGEELMIFSDNLFIAKHKILDNQ
jgi:DNA adenine methylase